MPGYIMVMEICKAEGGFLCLHERTDGGRSEP
jgi:hypothetical protein